MAWHPRSMALETKSDAAGQVPTILQDAVAKFRVRLAHPLRGRRDSNTPARTPSRWEVGWSGARCWAWLDSRIADGGRYPRQYAVAPATACARGLDVSRHPCRNHINETETVPPDDPRSLFGRNRSQA